LDFDPTRLKKFYNEKFEKGKDLARKLKKDQEKQTKEKSEPTEPKKKEEATNKNNVIQKLKDLAELKKDGVITEAEFDKMKARILD